MMHGKIVVMYLNVPRTLLAGAVTLTRTMFMIKLMIKNRRMFLIGYRSVVVGCLPFFHLIPTDIFAMARVVNVSNQ